MYFSCLKKFLVLFLAILNKFVRNNAKLRKVITPELSCEHIYKYVYVYIHIYIYTFMYIYIFVLLSEILKWTYLGTTDNSLCIIFIF